MKRFLFSCLLTVVFLSFASPFVLAREIVLPFDKSVAPEAQPLLQHLPQLEVTPTDQEKKENLSIPAIAMKRLFAQTGKVMIWFLAPIAAFLILVAGYDLVTAQSTVSEEIVKEKMAVIYILLGLTLFALGPTLIYNYVYVDQGIRLLGEGSAIGLAKETALRIKEILNLFLNFAGAGAILMLVISGIRLVLNPGDEAGIETHKKTVAYTAVGIVIIGLADTLVNQVVFPEGGYNGVNIQAFEVQLKGLSNYILGFLGATIFISLVISGVLMVINQGDEEMWGKIKTTLKNITIGVVIVYSAYTVVATLISTLLGAQGGTPY